MGYRIDYDRGTQCYEVKEVKLPSNGAMTLICFGIFLFLTYCFWPEGMEWIRDFLIPGDDAVTISAFQNLTRSLRAGTGMKDAVTAFCREVLIGQAHPY